MGEAVFGLPWLGELLAVSLIVDGFIASLYLELLDVLILEVEVVLFSKKGVALLPAKNKRDKVDKRI
jgi:hypothetical protein